MLEALPTIKFTDKKSVVTSNSSRHHHHNPQASKYESPTPPQLEDRADCFFYKSIDLTKESAKSLYNWGFSIFITFQT